LLGPSLITTAFLYLFLPSNTLVVLSSLELIWSPSIFLLSVEIFDIPTPSTDFTSAIGYILEPVPSVFETVLSPTL